VRRHALRALAAGFVVLAGLPRTSAAPADDNPAQPVHLIVSFPAGTAVDTLGRIVGTKLATALVNRSSFEIIPAPRETSARRSPRVQRPTGTPLQSSAPQ